MKFCPTVIIPVLLVLMSATHRSDSLQTTWRSTTACYGADPDCSVYKIECGAGERIIIGSLKYGGKSNPTRCQFGISDCDEPYTQGNVTKGVDSWCCNYDPKDYLTDFTAENRTAVLQNCNGQHACSGSVPRVFRVAYSSYVWMQYTCINDDSSIQMCSKNIKSGLDIFVTFNLSLGYTFPSLNGSRDCTCLVQTLDCASDIELRVVDFNFTSESTTSSLSNCSSAYLDLMPSRRLDCQSSVNLSSIVYRHNGWKDKIAVRSLFRNGTSDRPGLIVVQVKAVQTRSPIVVECYQPGVEQTTDTNTHCPKTTTTTTTTTTRRPATTTLTGPTTSATSITRGSSSTSLKISSISSTETTRTRPTPTLFDQTSTASSGSSSDTGTTQLGYTQPTNSEQTVTDISLQTNATTTSDSITSSPTVVTNTISSFTPFTTESTNSNISTNISYTGQSQTTQSSYTPRVPDTSPDQPTLDGNMTSTESIYTTEQSGLSTVDLNGHASSGGTADTRPITSISNVYEVTSTDLTTRTVDVDTSGSNTKLIIGLTVGIIVAALLVSAIIALSCYVRLKRKEHVQQRHYFRNTNIFYSIPDDFNTADHVPNDPAEMTHDEEDRSFSTIPRDFRYDDIRFMTDLSKTRQDTGTPSLVDDAHTLDCNGVEKAFPTQLDQSFQSNTSNTFVEFVNGTQPAVIDLTEFDNNTTDDLDVYDNSDIKYNGHLPDVTFDPSSLYSKVKKEGKTQF